MTEERNSNGEEELRSSVQHPRVGRPLLHRELPWPPRRQAPWPRHHVRPGHRRPLRHPQSSRHHHHHQRRRQEAPVPDDPPLPRRAQEPPRLPPRRLPWRRRQHRLRVQVPGRVPHQGEPEQGRRPGPRHLRPWLQLRPRGWLQAGAAHRHELPRQGQARSLPGLQWLQGRRLRRARALRARHGPQRHHRAGDGGGARHRRRAERQARRRAGHRRPRQASHQDSGTLRLHGRQARQVRDARRQDLRGGRQAEEDGEAALAEAAALSCRLHDPDHRHRVQRGGRGRRNLLRAGEGARRDGDDHAGLRRRARRRLRRDAVGQLRHVGGVRARAVRVQHRAGGAAHVRRQWRPPPGALHRERPRHGVAPLHDHPRGALGDPGAAGRGGHPSPAAQQDPGPLLQAAKNCSYRQWRRRRGRHALARRGAEEARDRDVQAGEEAVQEGDRRRQRHLQLPHEPLRLLPRPRLLGHRPALPDDAGEPAAREADHQRHAGRHHLRQRRQGRAVPPRRRDAAAAPTRRRGGGARRLLRGGAAVGGVPGGPGVQAQPVQWPHARARRERRRRRRVQDRLR